MNEFLNFDKMITPTIIKIIFWLGVIGSVIFGLVQIFGGGFFVIIGLLTLILGPLFVRIYCEILIIFFKMNDNLNEIKKSLYKE